jgi:hypothetical protein
MNTLKTIYDKLGDKTELAKHEVNLATIDDLKKNLLDMENAIKKIAESKVEFKKNVRLIEAKATDTAGKNYSTIKSQAMDLGINPDSIPEVKNYFVIRKKLADAVNAEL